MSKRTTRVLLVGRGAPETGGIAAFLTSLDHDTNSLFETELLNLTRTGDMGDGGAFSRQNVARTIADIRSVWRAAVNVDLVHIHSALAPSSTIVRAGLLATAARARRKPVLIHAHGGRLVSFAEQAGNRRLLRLSLRAATHFIAVSRGVAKVLHDEFGEAQVTFVPNGVDADRFTAGIGSPSGQSTRILYVGHLSERKGVLDLLHASQALRERGMTHELVLVGGRPDEGNDEYRRIIGEIEKTDGAAQLVGAVEHDAMPAIYQDADVFCLPSWWEAMPLSILEAMASGKPVVATNVGDVSLLVDDGRTGFVVNAQSRDDLGDALATLLVDADLREKMGSAGRQRAVDEFSSALTHQRLADVYEGLL